MSKYKTVIGLEMHCEVKSNAKVFSKSKNSISELANEYVSVVDMAFPGVLPTLNKTCVKKALMASIILNCEQPEYLCFDRKNYYYPDLPKGYQITQMYEPVGVNGSITIDCNGIKKEVKIHDIHLEEDTAILNHYSDATLIDYNRCGMPQLELVTEPCLNSADEAIAFLEEMRRIYQYTDISDCDIKKGEVRCDVNVNLQDELGNFITPKVEIKHVSSFSSIYEAINAEVKRQTEMLDAGKGNELEQETRRFDEETGTTIRMRSKEDAIDYRYFVEPNIPRYKISKEWLEKIKNEIPVLPNERKLKYINEYNLSEYDANIIIKTKEYSDYYEECLKLKMNPKQAANWLIVHIIAYLNKEDISIKDFYLKPQLLNQIIKSLEDGTISSKQAKEIFNKSLSEQKEPINFIDKDNPQITNKEELEKIVNSILSQNQNQIEAYHNGKTNLFDYFIGQVMKETKGKANPVLTKEILTEKLTK